LAQGFFAELLLIVGSAAYRALQAQAHRIKDKEHDFPDIPIETLLLS